MSQGDISITAQPLTDALCNFTVDRPVYPDRSFFFGSAEAVEGSPLAERLFAIEGVRSVLISHNEVKVTKNSDADWTSIGRPVGAAIREHLATGEPAVSEEARSSLPPAEKIREKVEHVLDTEINPAVSMHGGEVRLIDVKDNVVYVQMGGGCQGCGQANVTLKFGVETAIRAAVPEVGDILDVTDHAAGRNPYYAPSGM